MVCFFFFIDYALSQAHLAMVVSENLTALIESSSSSSSTYTSTQRNLCQQLQARNVICVVSHHNQHHRLLHTLLAESGSSILAIYSADNIALAQEDLQKIGMHVCMYEGHVHIYCMYLCVKYKCFYLCMYVCELYMHTLSVFRLCMYVKNLLCIYCMYVCMYVCTYVRLVP